MISKFSILNPILVHLFFSFFLTTSLFGQVDKVNLPSFKTDKTVYSQGDTISLNYNLDSLEVLHSNFGGCGGGPVYFASCHTDSMWTMVSQPTCAYLLEKFDYSDQGNFKIVIHHPGIYSISFYVRNKNQKVPTYENRFSKIITSTKFEVLSK